MTDAIRQEAKVLGTEVTVDAKHDPAGLLVDGDTARGGRGDLDVEDSTSGISELGDGGLPLHQDQTGGLGKRCGSSAVCREVAGEADYGGEPASGARPPGTCVVGLRLSVFEHRGVPLAIDSMFRGVEKVGVGS